MASEVSVNSQGRIVPLLLTTYTLNRQQKWAAFGRFVGSHFIRLFSTLSKRKSFWSRPFRACLPIHGTGLRFGAGKSWLNRIAICVGRSGGDIWPTVRKIRHSGALPCQHSLPFQLCNYFTNPHSFGYSISCPTPNLPQSQTPEVHPL